MTAKGVLKLLPIYALPLVPLATFIKFGKTYDREKTSGLCKSWRDFSSFSSSNYKTPSSPLNSVHGSISWNELGMALRNDV